MQSNLIDQGLSLMLYGMGTVFVFLTVLVFATTLMSKIVTRLNPVADSSNEGKEPTATALTSPLPQEIKTAIEHAIALHRKR